LARGQKPQIGDSYMLDRLVTSPRAQATDV